MKTKRLNKTGKVVFFILALLLSESIAYASSGFNPKNNNKYGTKSTAGASITSIKTDHASKGVPKYLLNISKPHDVTYFDWEGSYKPLDYFEYLRLNPNFGKYVTPKFSVINRINILKINGALDNQRVTKPLILIFEDSTIEADIRQDFNRYVFRLMDEGYEVITVNWNQGPAEELRDLLIDTYRNPLMAWNGVLSPENDYILAGTILLGNLPVFWIEFDYCRGHVENPSVYPYMDLDGQWIDNDGDGIFDDHNDGEWSTINEGGTIVTVNNAPHGTMDPEIWCGVIPFPKGVDRQEGIRLLRDYFQRNMRFRTQGVLNGRMLFYSDDDTARFCTPTIGKLYNVDNIDEVTGYGETNADDFKRRFLSEVIIRDDGNLSLPPATNNDWAHISAHGTSDFISFKKRFRNHDTVTAQDFRNAPRIRPYFSIFESCGPNRFTEEEYIGNYFLFGDNTNGLAMLSSSGVFYIFPMDRFYSEISTRGKTMGDAYKEMVRGVVHNPIIDMRQALRQLEGAPPSLGWFYSQILLGDPTLMPANHLVDNNRGSQLSFEQYFKNKYYNQARPDLKINNLIIKHGENGAIDNIEIIWSYFDANNLSVGSIAGNYCGGQFSFYKIIPGQYVERPDIIFQLYLNDVKITEMPINTQNTKVPIRRQLGAGEHRIRAVLDARRSLNESSEDNNTKEKIIRICNAENEIDYRATDIYFYSVGEPIRIEYQGYLKTEWWITVDQVLNIVGLQDFVNPKYRFWINGLQGEILSEELGDNMIHGISPEVLCTVTDMGLEEPFGEYDFNAELVEEADSNLANNGYSKRLIMKY